MRSALLVTFGLAAALLSGAGAEAQTIPSPFQYIEPTQSAGVFAGYLFTNRGEFDTGPASAPLFGARYTVRFSGPLSGEVGIGVAPSSRTIYERVTVPGTDSTFLDPVTDADAVILLAEAGLRFQITGPRTWNGLAPYLSATGGIVGDARRSHPVEEALERSQRVSFGPAFAVSAGAGTDWFLTERLSLRLEARDYVWRLTHPEGLAGSGRQETEWTHNLGVSLGAAVYF